MTNVELFEYKRDTSTDYGTDTGQGKALFLNNYVETLIRTGMASADQANFYTSYNSLHNLPYFDTHTASNLHIFLTRPHLNLSPANLEMSNEFIAPTYTREGCMLLASLTDPILRNIDKGYAFHNKRWVNGKWKGYGPNTGAGAIAFENMQTYGLAEIRYTPFIPLVSNLSFAISGMKDIVTEKYEYDGDQAGNRTSEAMGMAESRSNGECTIEFVESSNLSITMLTYLWQLYMDMTGRGLMSPTRLTLTDLIYDYMSSIYWFVTGQDGMSIKLYGKMTGVFPVNTPITSLIPGRRGQAPSTDISISFHYNHHEIMKPEILFDFNWIITKSMECVVGYNDKYGMNGSPIYHNEYVSPWLSKNFKYLSTSDSENMGPEADVVIPNLEQAFYPNEQNQWLGHPWITKDGKLVYRDMTALDYNYRHGPDAEVTYPPDEMMFGDPFEMNEALATMQEA